MWHLKRGKKRINNFKLIQNLTLLLKGEKTKVSTKASVNRNQCKIQFDLKNLTV